MPLAFGKDTNVYGSFIRTLSNKLYKSFSPLNEGLISKIRKTNPYVLGVFVIKNKAYSTSAFAK